MFWNVKKLHSSSYSLYSKDKTLLELIPLVLGICTWSSELKNLKLMLHIDNLALAQNINKKIKNKIKG